jgi:hypothetical protein
MLFMANSKRPSAPCDEAEAAALERENADLRRESLAN